MKLYVNMKITQKKMPVLTHREI